MKATIKDIKEADKIITERKGINTYSDRMENMLLSYTNIFKDGEDLVIRLYNGTYRSVYNYV